MSDRERNRKEERVGSVDPELYMLLGSGGGSVLITYFLIDLHCCQICKNHLPIRTSINFSSSLSNTGIAHLLDQTTRASLHILSASVSLGPAHDPVTGSPLLLPWTTFDRSWTLQTRSTSQELQFLRCSDPDQMWSPHFLLFVFGLSFILRQDSWWRCVVPYLWIRSLNYRHCQHFVSHLTH